MSSVHGYQASELPAPYYPGGTAWMAGRLASLGYQDTRSWYNNDTGLYYLCVEQDHISKNQLAFDVNPPDGSLTVSRDSINVTPGGQDWGIIRVYGPVGETVNVRFAGTGYLTSTQFEIPQGGFYNFQFGPCPAGQFVVEPQAYEFYVEGYRISPVVVLATFR